MEVAGFQNCVSVPDGTPVAANLATAVKAATSEGRDLTDGELQQSVDGEQAAFDALVAARAASQT